MELKKGECELVSVELDAVPSGMLDFVHENYGGIAEVQRFRARNWRRKVHAGYAFRTEKGVVVVKEGCELRSRNHTGPAWSVSACGDITIQEAVDGLYCHTVIKVSFCGYNTPVRDQPLVRR